MFPVSLLSISPFLVAIHGTRVKVHKRYTSPPPSLIMQSKMMSKPNTTTKKLVSNKRKRPALLFYKPSSSHPERQTIAQRRKEAQILCTKEIDLPVSCRVYRFFRFAFDWYICTLHDGPREKKTNNKLFLFVCVYVLADRRGNKMAVIMPDVGDDKD